MKKLIASVAVSLLCLSAFCQDASLTGYARYENLMPDFNLGNSSFYSTLEGSFANEQFSYYVENHWLGEPCGDLYTSTFHSDALNWLNEANITWQPGIFSLTAGKFFSLPDGIEGEECNWDCNYPVMSVAWNNPCCYQWGVKAAISTPSENSSLALTATTSQYGEYFFKSRLFSYGAQFLGDYGPLHLNWAASYIQAPEGAHEWMIGLGQKLSFDKFYLTFDWIRNFGLGEDSFIGDDADTFILTADYDFCNAFEAYAKGGFEKYRTLDSRWFAGAELRFYPVRDSRNLRIHLLGAWDNLVGKAQLSLGVTFNFNIFSL